MPTGQPDEKNPRDHFPPSAGETSPSLPDIPDHELLRRIGRGGHGDIWLAKNIVGTYRAVKIVRREEFHDETPFEQEFAGTRKCEPVG